MSSCEVIAESKVSGQVSVKVTKENEKFLVTWGDDVTPFSTLKEAMKDYIRSVEWQVKWHISESA